MGIIATLIGALFIGFLARFFYPGEVKLGWLQSIGLGLLGSLVGKLIAFVLGLGWQGGAVTSIIGACAVIFIYRNFIEKKLK